MKQTNNALKFLLAQYRAIFKNARLKDIGLSALLVATVSTAANATPAGNDYWEGLKDNQTFTPSADIPNIAISGGATNDNNFKLTITGPKDGSNNNTIKGTVSGKNGEIIISGGVDSDNNNNPNNVLTIGDTSPSNAAATALTLNKFTVNNGRATVNGEKAATELKVNTLTVGDKSSTKDAELLISGGASQGSTATVGSFTAGDKEKKKLASGTTITLNKDGIIRFNKGAAGDAILQGLKIEGEGLLDFKGSGGTLAVGTGFEGEKAYVEDSKASGSKIKIDVDSGATANIAIKADQDKRGVLHLGSGSIINLKSTKGQSGGILSIASAGTSDSDLGTIVKIDKGALIGASGASGNAVAKISIAGNSTASNQTEKHKSILSIEASVLDSFLNADEVNLDGTSAKKDLAGSVDVGANGVLEVNFEKDANLKLSTTASSGFDKENKDLTLKLGTDTTNAGVVGITASDASKNSTIKSKNIVIEKAIALSNKKLHVEADNLTLGSKDFSGTGSFAVSGGITVHNKLTLSKTSDNNNAFQIKDAITFDGSYYKKDDNGFNTKDLTDFKKIEGSNFDIDSGGKLTITGGFWGTSNDVKLAQDSTLEIKPLDAETGEGDAKNKYLNKGNTAAFKISGSKLDLSSGAITISGASGAGALLDLSEVGSVTFNTTNGQSGTAITISGKPTDIYNKANGDESSKVENTLSNGYGVLKVKNDSFLKKFLTPEPDAGQPQTVTNKLTLSGGGVLHVVFNNSADKGEYTFDKFASGTATPGKVTFSGEGIAFFDGEVSLYQTKKTGDTAPSSSGAALNIGSGTIVANTLNLNNDYIDTTSDPDNKKHSNVEIASGTIVVRNALNSKESTVEFKGNTNTSDAVLNLNAEKSGSVNADLLFTKGDLKVTKGGWSAQRIEIKDGSITVGKEDDDIAPSLSANYLKLASGKEIKLHEGSSFRAETLNASGATINLSGSNYASVSGISLTKPQSGDDYKNDESLLNGFTVQGANININSGSKFEIGTNVLNTQKPVETFEDGDDDSSSSTKLEQYSITFKVEDGKTIATIHDALKAHYKVDETSTLILNFDDKYFGDKGLSVEQAAALKEGLFDGSNSKLDGVLDLGNAKLDVKWTDDSKQEIKWDDIAGFTQITGSDVTTKDLKKATVIDIDADDKISGHFGALRANSGVETITINHKFGLYNAREVNGKRYYAYTLDNNDNATTVGLNSVSNNHAIILEGGGYIGGVKAAKLNVRNGGETVFEGNVETNEFSLTVAEKDPVTTITRLIKDDVLQDLTVKSNLTTAANTELYAGTITLGNESNSQIQSAKDVGVHTFAGLVEANKIVVDKGVKSVTLSNGQVKSKELSLQAGTTLYVGGFKAPTNEESGGSSFSGMLEVGNAKLNGAYLKTTASAASYTAIKSFNNATRDNNSIGTIDGDIFIGQKSAVGLGVTMEEMTETLANNRYSSVLYADNVFTIGNGKGLTLTDKDEKSFITSLANDKDFSQDKKDFIAKNFKFDVDTNNLESSINNGIYFGGNSALIINGESLHQVAVSKDQKGTPQDNAYIKFEGKTDGKNTIIADGGSVVISGRVKARTYQLFAGGDNLQIVNMNGETKFTPAKPDDKPENPDKGEADKGDDSTEKMLSTRDDNKPQSVSIAVTNANGFLSGKLYNDNQDGTASSGQVELTVDKNARNVMSAASNPVFETLKTYALGYKNEGKETSDYIGDFDSKRRDGSAPTDEELKNLNNYTYENEFIQQTIDFGDGAAVETAARLGVYGGAPQAAMKAGASTYESMTGRFGMANNAFAGAHVYANQQGGSVWLTPVQSSYESEGFGAEGLNYGVDVDFYSLAVGGDYTLNNNLRFGLALNLGKGDSSGNMAAAGASNDFDFFGFGAYAGYAYENFAVMGDISYTVVNNEIKGNNFFDRVNAKFDSSNLSAGINAQYAFKYKKFDVVPHVGARFTKISMDDYNVKGTFAVAKSKSDDLSYISFPVGASISKDIISGKWTVKSILDITATAYTGDDTIDSTVNWNIQNLDTKLKTEILDSFSYGATFGVAGSKEGFSFAVGIGFDKSSHVDNLQYTGSFRFVF